MTLQERILAALTARSVKRSLLRALLPDASPEALDAAIRAMVKGGAVIFRCGHYERTDPAPVAILTRRRRIAAALGMPLTFREEEVCELACAGKSSREIASALGISRKGVSAHLSSIYAKLGVEGRLGLTRGPR